ncbi:hypothetical protein G6F59_015327 [Rhizopus arrhizus]|nr:hypothetical protein G6F59_015327 [Rhizopus arrhizus]
MPSVDLDSSLLNADSEYRYRTQASRVWRRAVATLCHQADVCGHHAPACRRAHPGLALATDALATVALEFQVGGGEVGAVGGDGRAPHAAGEALRRAPGAECADRVVAVQVFACAVAQGVRAIPEQGVQHVHLVVDEGGLVALERRCHFRHDVGQVDFHASSPYAPFWCEF